MRVFAAMRGGCTPSPGCRTARRWRRRTRSCRPRWRRSRRVIHPPIKRRPGASRPYFPAGARLRAQFSTARLMVLGLSATVLLVVGLNISGMMLVRSAMRQRELAVRAAMGASRWRLMRYHLSEALVLALLGGSLASAILFGGPIVIASAARHVAYPRSISFRARSLAGAAVHRALPGDQPRAWRAAGAALQPPVDHHAHQERFRRQRPARRPPAALHRGRAGRTGGAVPSHLRRLSRSGPRHRPLPTSASRRKACMPRASTLPPIAKTDEEQRLFVRTVQREPRAGAGRHVGQRRRRHAARLRQSQRARRASGEGRSSRPTRRASGRATWKRSARACSPAARSTPPIATAPSASSCCPHRWRVSSSRPATRSAAASPLRSAVTSDRPIRSSA